MRKKNKIITLTLLISFLFSCRTTEKIGDYKYEVKVKRVNTGDFGGMIEYIKTYYLNNEFQAGCTIKSQLLGHEKPTDTIFSTGYTFIDPISKELKCFEFNFFWYNKVADNGTYRYFIQGENGKLVLKEYRKISFGPDQINK